MRCSKNTKNDNKTTQSKIKSPETYDIHWRRMVYGKIAKGLPPLMRPKISKRYQ